jgi:hypothetical protein
MWIYNKRQRFEKRYSRSKDATAPADVYPSTDILQTESLTTHEQHRRTNASDLTIEKYNSSTSHAICSREKVASLASPARAIASIGVNSRRYLRTCALQSSPAPPRPSHTIHPSIHQSSVNLCFGPGCLDVSSAAFRWKVFTGWVLASYTALSSIPLIKRISQQALVSLV